MARDVQDARVPQSAGMRESGPDRMGLRDTVTLPIVLARFPLINRMQRPDRAVMLFGWHACYS